MRFKYFKIFVTLPLPDLGFSRWVAVSMSSSLPLWARAERCGVCHFLCLFNFQNIGYSHWLYYSGNCPVQSLFCFVLWTQLHFNLIHGWNREGLSPRPHHPILLLLPKVHASVPLHCTSTVSALVSVCKRRGAGSLSCIPGLNTQSGNCCAINWCLLSKYC